MCECDGASEEDAEAEHARKGEAIPFCARAPLCMAPRPGPEARRIFEWVSLADLKRKNRAVRAHKEEIAAIASPARVFLVVTMVNTVLQSAGQASR